jgi:hypothetical protein
LMASIASSIGAIVVERDDVEVSTRG